MNTRLTTPASDWSKVTREWTVSAIGSPFGSLHRSILRQASNFFFSAVTHTLIMSACGSRREKNEDVKEGAEFIG
jgi:hypothetical protein